MKHISEENYTKNRNTPFCFQYAFFFENRVVCEVMWKRMVQPDRQTTDDNMAHGQKRCDFHAG
jgi:hypothetical protein